MKRARIRSRILSAAGILGFVGAIVVFDLGCPSDSSSGAAVVAQVVVSGPGAVRVGGTVTLAVALRNNSGSSVSGVPVTWKSSDVTIATVSGDANGAYVTGVSQGPVTITATSQFVDGNHAITVSNVPVATVTVSGPSSVQIGSSIQLTATPKDAAGNVLTGRVVTWSSSNSQIASVNSTTGQVTGVAIGGPVTITATSEFTDGTAQVTVTGAPVASVTLSGLSTVDIGVGIGLTVVLKDAAGNVLSNRQVSWVSSNPSVATVSGTNTDATVTGVAAGTTIITATSEGVPGMMQITVGAARLSGQVINYVTGAGISGATVNYRDASGGGLWGSNTSGADGSFTSPATSSNIANGVIIEAIAAGFVTGRIYVPSVTPGVTNYAGQLPLVPNATAGGISGTVRNALNATGIAGATVSLYDNIALGPITTQTSDGNGNFTFNAVSAGTYRLHASVTGFTAVNRTGVAVGNGSVTSGQDIVLAPSGTNFVRIVLTWGSTPSDLDSHITGPTSGGRFHVYYNSRGALTATPFTFLDIDDTSGIGPETVTITQMLSGTYRYSVHDFSNRNSTTSTALGASGARVEVYTAAGLAQTFFAPPGPGTLWTVFEVSGTLANPLITPVNTKSFISDPSAIPSPPIADATDAALIGRAVAQHPKAKPH